MKIISGTYKDWEAIYCYGEDCTLIVGVSRGPRILYFSYSDGPNLLYQDHTRFHVGDWYLYGGHRFTIAPESDRSYFPDPEPCKVSITQEALLVETARAPEGIRKSIRITLNNSRNGGSGKGFDIAHILTNNGTDPWEGALWAITCVPAAGSIQSKIMGGEVQVWPGTKRGLWQLDGDGILVLPDGSRGKIGWYNNNPEITNVTPQYQFTIRAEVAATRSQCVDGGCNLELFFCQDYYELETLSGLTVLAPGHTVSHTQQWRIQMGQNSL